MTDEGKSPEAKQEPTQQRSDWASEAEAALEGVGDALRRAWDASRDARLSALESAKKAAQQLGEAIDEGVAAAKEKWETQAASTAETENQETPTTAPTPPHHTPQMRPDEGRSNED